jgi:4-aminobutyrate aminotransferase-like enzyme
MYILPGNRSKELWKKDTQFVISGRSNIADSLHVVFEKGEGVHIFDVDGNKYLDFSAGILTAATGHSHPHLVKRVKDQVEKLSHVYAFPTPDRYKLTEKLSERMPPGIDTYSFYCEGAITVEAALRAASSYNKRYLYVATTHAYHGRTLLTRSLGSHLLPKEFGPTVNVAHLHYPYCYRCPFKLKYPKCDLACAESAEDILRSSGNEKPGALLFEPIIGAGGIIVPPANAIRRMVEIARHWDMVIIADEVLTGVGRTGRFLAVEHFGIEPDLATFGKGLGSGIPVMCIAGKREIMSSAPFGESGGGGSSTSFGGNPVSNAAALATLEILDDEKLVENAARLGEEIKVHTADWREKYKIVGDVRGLGLLWGVELVKNQQTKEPFPEAWGVIYKKCMSNGVRLVPNRICPPLNITSEQLHHGLDIIEDAIKDIDHTTK